MGRPGDPVSAEEVVESTKSTITSDSDLKPAKTTIAGDQPDPRVGETLLKAGDYASALDHFLPTDPLAKGTNSDRLAFCAGICQEGLGHWNEALAAYREAVTTTRDLL